MANPDNAAAAAVDSCNEEEEEVREGSDTVNPPNRQQAVATLETLQLYLLSEEGSEEAQSSLLTVERFVGNSSRRLKQLTMRDFVQSTQ